MDKAYEDLSRPIWTPRKIDKLYVDKKTESFPTWLAEARYDKTSSFRDSFINNALKKHARVFSAQDQEARNNLIEAKINDQIVKRLTKKEKKNWRDSVKFIL